MLGIHEVTNMTPLVVSWQRGKMYLHLYISKPHHSTSQSVIANRMQIMHFYLQAYKSIFGGRGIFDHAFLGQNESPPQS